MNTARLAEALRFLVEDENHLELQKKLELVKERLQSLTEAPSNPDVQVAFSTALSNLRDSLDTAAESYGPSQRDRIYNLGAENYFTPRLAEVIENSIGKNPLTPAVTLELVNKLSQKRSLFLKEIENTLRGLEEFQLDDEKQQEGTSDVGFEIPRSLFDNKLNGLIKELRSVQRIIRVFSETETGSIKDIEVRDISTSAPLFFFGIEPPVAAAIALAVAWGLSQWKKIEEIRKIRAETLKTKTFTDSEVKEFFDAKIKDRVNQAVESEVKEILKRSTLDRSRKNEISSELAWALQAIFARLERGMKIEFRYLPPKEHPAKPIDPGQKALFNQIGAVAGELRFPNMEGSPILALPSVRDADPVRTPPAPALSKRTAAKPARPRAARSTAKGARKDSPKA